MAQAPISISRHRPGRLSRPVGPLVAALIALAMGRPAGALTGAAGAGAGAATVCAEGYCGRDVVYGSAAGQTLRMDIGLPPGAGPFPAVIMVHGGGWMFGDKAVNCAPLFGAVNRAGIAWFSVNYRLAPAFRYPACIDDVETAVRWVRANAARFRVNPRRLALLGESAGGHIVDEVAVRAGPATRVSAVVSFYAPCDLLADTRRRGGLSRSMTALFGLNRLDAAAERTLREASPLNAVGPSLPPFLLLHGTDDKSVPYNQSVAWQARLRALGVPCELITIPGGIHSMGRWNKLDPGYPQQVAVWLARNLESAGPAGRGS